MIKEIGFLALLWLIAVVVLPDQFSGVMIGLIFILISSAAAILQSWIFWCALAALVIIYLLMSIREEIIAGR